MPSASSAANTLRWASSSGFTPEIVAKLAAWWRVRRRPQDVESHAHETVLDEAKLPGRTLGHVDDRSFPVVATVGSAIDDPHDHVAPVLEIGHAHHGSERQRAMRSDHLAFVEDPSARGLFTVESGTIVRCQTVLYARSARAGALG